MLFYAVAVLPLIRSLSESNPGIQTWYADDSACAAKLTDLRAWFDKLRDLGPDFGYYPEPAKSILVVDPRDLPSVSQLCSGLKAGIEGAVHGSRELFAENAGTGWGILLIDTHNAFNSLNRVAALWNSRILWPQCSRFLFNTYRGYATLIVHGIPEVLFSREGVTQGDPLSMLFYAVAVLSLIRSYGRGLTS